jgi:ribokinase
MIDRSEAFLAAGEVMLLQLEIPIATVERALQFAKGCGMTTILNPAPACLLTESLLRHVDLLTPNETEAEALTGITVSGLGSAERAAAFLLARGARAVIVTLGAQGALLCTGSTVRHVPAFPVEVVDTTAAGDAFSGGLAAALAASRRLGSHWDARLLEDATRFAGAAGALATTRRGAQESLPGRDEILRLLKRFGGNG